MQTVTMVVLLIVGILLIVKGGDWFVDASGWIAEVLGIPPFIVGATIVSVATTLPEVLVSCFAAAEGNVGMAVGNAVGSVNSNIALIMGISIVFIPHSFDRKNYIFKSAMLIGAILILLLLCINGSLNMYLSIILLGVFALFIIENIFSVKKQNAIIPIKEVNVDEVKKEVRSKIKPTHKEIIKNVVFFILGSAGIVIGAQLLVDNAGALAIKMGISQSLIAVTLVAIGTSLPELVTTVVAISKKRSDLSIGNIIGANIIDITLILPLCALITGSNLPVGIQSMYFDIPFCLLVSCITLIPSLITKKFQRWQGILLLLLYIAYLAVLIAFIR